MNAIEVLKQAKKCLWNGIGVVPYEKDQFTCLAVVTAATQVYPEYDYAEAEDHYLIQEIRSKIRKAISYHYTVEVYFHKVQGYAPNKIEAQDFRMKILEDLIKEYEGKQV